MTLLWVGSSKDVFYDSKRGFGLKFSKRVSVFDLGPIPAAFDGLDDLRRVIAVRLLQVLKGADIRNHFVKHIQGTNKILVKPLDVPEKDVVFENAVGRLLPLEFLYRFVVTKKLLGRIERGEIDRASVESLLVRRQKLGVGARLCPAFVECSTKHRASDMYLTDVYAADLASISLSELQRIYDTLIRPAADIFKNFFRQAGFDNLDGKFECGLLKDGSPIIADSNSPDELRLVDGDGRSCDKDPVRQWYEENCPEWFMAVKEAKKKYPNDKNKWPTYEVAPPQDVIDDVVGRYRAVAEAIGAL